MFPQKFKKQFDEINIDIDKAEYGRWIDAKQHRKSAKAYNQAWQEILDSGQVNDKNAWEHAKKIMKLIYDMDI